MDYTQATEQSHMDRHRVFRNSVHRRGDERGLQTDPPGDPGLEPDLGSGEVDVPRQDEEIIVGNTSTLRRVQQFFDTKTIAGFILFAQDFESLGMIEWLLRIVCAARLPGTVGMTVRDCHADVF